MTAELLVIGPTPVAELKVIGPQRHEALMIQPERADTILIGPLSHPVIIEPVQVVQVAPTAALRVEPPRAPVKVQAQPSMTVEPPPRAAWDERGWTRRTVGAQTVYEGEYQIFDRRRAERRRFPGRITEQHGQVTPFIFNPPADIKRHPKGPCFMLHQDGWFRVNWHRPATDVENALLYVEKVLDEAINRR